MMKVIFSLIVCCLAMAAASPVDTQNIKEFGQLLVNCALEVGYNQDKVSGILSTDEKEKKECHAACVLKGLGCLNPNDTVNENVFAEFKYTPEEIEETRKLIIECQAKAHQNPCKFAACL